MLTPDAPVAVTGAGGYLGGRMVSAAGVAARALVRAPVPWLSDGQVKCDLLAGPDAVAGALTGVDTVIHLAGHNEIASRRRPDRAGAETVTMTENLVAAAAECGVRRIVYLSTVHVYGDRLAPGAVIDESTPESPRPGYPETRLACERILSASTDVESVVLRLTNAVGPPADASIDRWTLVASDLCRSGVVDGRLVLHSSGAQHRDFIAIDDACRIAAEASDPAVPPGTYNLSSGTSRSIRDLATLVQDRLEIRGGRRPPLDAPPLDGPADMAYTVKPDALADLGLVVRTPIEQAIDDLVEFCESHRDLLAGINDE